MGMAVVWPRLRDPLSAGTQVLENGWGPGAGDWAQRPPLPLTTQVGRGRPPGCWAGRRCRLRGRRWGREAQTGRVASSRVGFKS